LCAWFVASQRPLAWRATRDPYAIWISEAMLQQTRVETVIPFHARFLARFPTLAELARATEEDVLAAWSGLGYYRRARALRAAAQELVRSHDARFPRDRATLLALPGFGPYTAAAVLSIAFDLSEPLVDGNVARVLARHFAIEAPIDSGPGRERSWELARELVPPGPRPGETGETVSPRNHNQGLMELGALICTPRAPRCDACPLRSSCAALARGLVDVLPRRSARPRTLDVRLEIVAAVHAGRILVVRRPETGRMARLWELPTRELPGPRGELHGLWPPAHALPLRVGPELGLVRHAITRHRISATVREGELDGPERDRDRERARWAHPAELEALALTGLARKALARAASEAGFGA
jgi:A/G-specific adenine glycosylase